MGRICECVLGLLFLLKASLITQKVVQSIQPNIPQIVKEEALGGLNSLSSRQH